MIPNIIHFVFGLTEDFGGRPFSLIHYMAVKSAYECNRPDIIYFHYAHEPSGEWWEKAKPYLTLSQVELPTEIFGRPLLHYAHRADVVRLEVLLKYGGIYLDIDVLCVKSFAPLRSFSVVMGKEREGGLCNAVILAEKEAPFIRRWYESYHSFRSTGKDEYWSEHSVEKPYEIAKEVPEQIHVVSRHRFFWPTYHYSWLLFGVGAHRHIVERVIGFFAQPVAYLIVASFSYGVHLYESMWWDKHLQGLTPTKIRTMRRNFGWLFRKYLP